MKIKTVILLYIIKSLIIMKLIKFIIYIVLK